VTQDIWRIDSSALVVSFRSISPYGQSFYRSEFRVGNGNNEPPTGIVVQLVGEVGFTRWASGCLLPELIRPPRRLRRTSLTRLVAGEVSAAFIGHIDAHSAQLLRVEDGGVRQNGRRGSALRRILLRHFPVRMFQFL